MTRAMIQLPIELTGLTGFAVRLGFAVTAALLCVWAVSALATRLSAALRHRVWSLGIIVSLMVPAMLLMAPERRFGLIGLTTHTIENTAAARWQGAAVASADNAIDHASMRGNTQLGNVPARLSTDVSKKPIARRHAFTWLTWLCISWSMPAIVLLARLIGGAIASRAIVRLARPVGLSVDCARLPAGKRLPTVLESDAVQSPLCVGWFRSTILLPTNWRTWPREQLQAVLTHELAHVARRDVLWQGIARLACAIYWPHPMVWYAARRMRIERELACDDFVVRRGASPTQYSRWLLDLACELKAARQMERLGVAMAGRNGLQTRVQAALDPDRCRTPVSKRMLLVLMTLAAMLLVIAGTLSPLRAVQKPAEQSPARPAAPETVPTPLPAASGDDTLRYVAGRIVDETGHGVGGARVTVPAPSAHTNAQTVTADPDGRFLVMLGSGKVARLIIRAESPDGTRQSAVPLRLQRPLKQADFQDVQVTLKPAAVFPVTVTDAENRAVAGATITVTSTMDSSVQTISDADGKATLRLAPDLRLVCIAARKNDVGLDFMLFGAGRFIPSDPRRLASNLAGPLQFKLDGIRTVVVKAVDRKARPLAGVSIRTLVVSKAGKGEIPILAESAAGEAETDANGIARVQVPADVDRPVMMGAKFGGYAQVGTILWDPKAGSDDITAVLQPMPRFHVSVVGMDGKPAGGAEVLMVYDRGLLNYGNFSNGPVGSDGTGDGMLLPDTYYMFAALMGNLASEPVMKVVRSGDSSRAEAQARRPRVRQCDRGRSPEAGGQRNAPHSVRRRRQLQPTSRRPALARRRRRPARDSSGGHVQPADRRSRKLRTVPPAGHVSLDGPGFKLPSRLTGPRQIHRADGAN